MRAGALSPKVIRVLRRFVPGPKRRAAAFNRLTRTRLEEFAPPAGSLRRSSAKYEELSDDAGSSAGVDALTGVPSGGGVGANWVGAGAEPPDGSGTDDGDKDGACTRGDGGVLGMAGGGGGGAGVSVSRVAAAGPAQRGESGRRSHLLQEDPLSR
jgi:hypothetical protein